MKPRRPIRKVSPTRQARLKEYAKVKKKFLREQTHCFSCLGYIKPEQRELHHFNGRIGRLLVWEPGFKMACGWCHAQIHAHPEEARNTGRLGLLGTWNDYERAKAHYESTTKSTK